MGMLDRFTRWLRFNLWYFRKPPWDTRQTPPELEAFCRRHPPGKALDLGCGTGTNLIYLARLGWQVTGVDFAWRAIAASRRRLAHEGLSGELILGSVAATDRLGQGYHLVLDIGCYHGLGQVDRAAYLSGLTHLLVPGGTFLLYAHLNDNPQGSIGVSEIELDVIAAKLRMVWRQDSLERLGRRAVWIEYIREG
jgi:SAM-dependent methyltransferase